MTTAPDTTVDPDTVHDHFLLGQCHALALAVAEATGWPLVGVGPWCPEPRPGPERDADLAEEPPDHVMAVTSDGLLLDVTGARTEDQVWEAYTGGVEGPFEVFDLTGADLDLLVDTGAYRPPDLTLARAVAARVLADAGYEAAGR